MADLAASMSVLDREALPLLPRVYSFSRNFLIAGSSWASRRFGGQRTLRVLKAERSRRAPPSVSWSSMASLMGAIISASECTVGYVGTGPKVDILLTRREKCTTGPCLSYLFNSCYKPVGLSAEVVFGRNNVMLVWRTRLLWSNFRLSSA